MNTTAVWFRSACAAALLGLAVPVWASGGTRVHYPDSETSDFTLEVPADWIAAPDVDDSGYIYVNSPEGVEMAFRAIEGDDFVAAMEAHVAYLQEHYTALKLGEAVQSQVNGIPALILPALGTDAQGSERDLGSGWFKLGEGRLGELWYNAARTDMEGKAQASAVLNSIRTR